MKSHELSPKSKTIRSIQLVIRNLGDNIHHHTLSDSKRKHIRLKRSRAADNVTDIYNDEDNTYLNDICAPIGLENQYQELYHLLYRGLIGFSEEVKADNENTGVSHTNKEKVGRGNKRNVSALLFGGRGNGKTLTLERCLTSLLKDHNHNTNDEVSKKKLFRILRLNGIVLRGDDAGLVVREIVKQLSDIAAHESNRRWINMENTKRKKTLTCNTRTHLESSIDMEKENDVETLHNTQTSSSLQKESYHLRTRQTSFSSSLALLDEALQTACIDSIPILIVLDELDSFLGGSSSSGIGHGSLISHTLNETSSSVNNTTRSGSRTNSGMTPSDRHLLLYHLLDRVAGHDSLLSLVGMTAKLSTVGMFEKRVKSRAEGTSKVIYFGHPSSFDIIADILLGKFDSIDVDVDNQPSDDESDVAPSTTTGNQTIKDQLRKILLPSKIESTKENSSNEENETDDQAKHVRYVLHRSFDVGRDVRWFCRVLSTSLSLYVHDLRLSLSNTLDFEPKYILEGLTLMGGTGNNLTSNAIPSSGLNKHSINFNTPRLLTLLDLPGSHVAVLLAAKRILMRDNQQEEYNFSKPLSFKRIHKEYEGFFLMQGKSTGPDRFDEHVFFKSFCGLIDCGLIRPVKDHTGGGPFQFNFSSSYFTVGIEASILKQIPIHVNLDLDSELGEALKRNLLDCTTAIRDWAMKNN